ncbi:transposase [Streptomyces sp. NPDC096311]|uniref:transposase n=1 Tax=Streptomyces sp. NPDC096311 TaxID=3366083 RepID=UPI0037FA0DA8
MGAETAGQLLVTAGDNPDRLASGASFAHLCAAAPVPVSSGRTDRHRPPPTQPRRRPAGQPRAADRRTGPHALRPTHPRLCRTTHPRRSPDEGHPQMRQALRRTRGLPSPRRRLQERTIGISSHLTV